MDSSTEQKKLALLTCIELVLMRRGNTQYNLVVARLNALYSCAIMDCFEHPDYLRDVLKEVYGKDYLDIVEEIMARLDELADAEDIRDFLKIMVSEPPAEDDRIRQS